MKLRGFYEVYQGLAINDQVSFLKNENDTKPTMGICKSIAAVYTNIHQKVYDIPDIIVNINVDGNTFMRRIDTLCYVDRRKERV